MNDASVGILSAASFLPQQTATVREIFAEEGIPADREDTSRLGIEQVHVFDGESPTDMAIEASLAALKSGGLLATDIDAIIDFSVMPQKYVEPAWSMSNELQAVLAARNAFTLGFSGGGCANLHVAIKFAMSLIRTNNDIDTVLLVASDRAIAGNRVIDRDKPITIIGDAASAFILQRAAQEGTIIDTAVVSEGRLHDVLNIPGGGMAHPTRLDLYRLMLNREKYESVATMTTLKSISETLLVKHALEMNSVDHLIVPNISHADIDAFLQGMGRRDNISRRNLARFGHVHSTDLVLNYLSMKETGIAKGDHVMMASHGMGFTSGATLIRY